MSTHPVNSVRETIPPHPDDRVPAAQPKWGQYVFVVILVLVCIAATVLFVYKLDHPTPIRVLQDHLFTAIARMSC